MSREIPGTGGTLGSASSPTEREPPLLRSADEESPSEHGRQRRWWPFLVPVVLIAVIVSLLTPAGRRQWALSLFRQPTDYTALSFNKAWALPATAAWDAPISISFNVANHEGRDVRYRYVLSERAVGGTQGATELQESARVVPAGATWTVSTSVRPTCATSRCRVEVSLPGQPETIDFLVNLTSGPAAGG